jgi:hypothetical protein
VLARPPAGPDAAERSSAAQDIKCGHGLGQDPGRPEGYGCHQRAQTKIRLQAREHPEGHPRLRDRLGYFYGTDSSAPTACGRGPYTEPVGSCANGTIRPYGEYMGMMGSWLNWEGCSASGLAWNQANYNMANDNFMNYHTGLGAAGYWFAAGHYIDAHSPYLAGVYSAGGRSYGSWS